MATLLCRNPLFVMAILSIILFWFVACSGAKSNSIPESKIAEHPLPAGSVVQRLISFLPDGVVWRGGFHSQKLQVTRKSRSLAVANSSSTATNGTRGGAAGPASAQAPSPVQAPAASSPLAKSKKKPLVIRWLAGIALGMVSGIISAVIVSFVFRFIYDWVKRAKPNKRVIFQSNIAVKSLDFLEKDDAFEDLEILGKGGSGEVYKATIDIKDPKKGGQLVTKVVALKKVIGVANSNSKAGVDSSLERSYDLTRNSAQIHAEMNTLGHVRHRNLVTLLAYVPKNNSHVLIYDYMPNGSLYDVLLKVRSGAMELPWASRFRIAQGVALGLKYLHFDARPTIIHRDLKPGNILLDEDMEAHIGDFGLAKIMPDSMTHFTSTNFAGTMGYIAPEYHQTLKYTSKADIYSFGVVLVVLLTGREPTDTLFSDVNTHMGAWVNMVVTTTPEEAMKVIDKSLIGQGCDEQMLLTFKIASFCLLDLPTARPTSNDIVKMFDQIQQTPPPASLPPPSPPPQ